MNRPGLSGDKLRLPQKHAESQWHKDETPQPTNQVSRSCPKTPFHLLPLRLHGRSYHLRPLSWWIRGTVEGPPSSFVEGQIGGSLWTALPPGGDPWFVMVSPTQRTFLHSAGSLRRDCGRRPWTLPSLSDTRRSGADCPNAILVSASVKAGVVDGHHAPGLRTSARVQRPFSFN